MNAMDQYSQEKKKQSEYIASLCHPMNSINSSSSENENLSESAPLLSPDNSGQQSLKPSPESTNASSGESESPTQQAHKKALVEDMEATLQLKESTQSSKGQDKTPASNLPLVALNPDEQAAHGGATHALFIDNSAIELWRCPRLFEYKFLRKRDLVASKAGRNFGSTLHIGWAARYAGGGVNKVEDPLQKKIEEAMQLYLVECPQPLDDFRNCNHACTVMRAYNAHYGNEPFKIITSNADASPVVEKPFAFWIFNFGDIAVIYCGKIDLAVHNNEGIWVMDHKTTFMFGDAFDAQMQMDGGQLGYCWAVKQATKTMPRGYIIDAVRIRRPKKGDEYNEAAAPVDASDFKRMPFFVTEPDLDAWKEDLFHIVRNILTTAAESYFPRHRWQCTTKFGRCDMYDVCSVGVASRESALASELYEDSHWSPLNTPNKVTE